MIKLDLIRSSIFWVVMLGCSLPTWSQSSLNQGPYFSYQNYFDWIVQNHPYSRQANLVIDKADAKMLKARGGFDPKLKSDVEQKSFDGKNYFTIGEVGVEAPSMMGLKFKSAYTWSSGIFLNPEYNLPSQGQIVVGLSANLGQGLFIDERRADLKISRIFQNASETERKALLIDLLLIGNDIYWDWVFNHEVLDVYQNAVAVAQERLNNTRESFFNGDKPAIDTLESFILLQDWQNQNADAILAVNNATLMLSNFLWSEDDVPSPFIGNIQAPQLEELPSVLLPYEEIVELDNIPELKLYDFELQSLDVERQLKIDKLKPKFELEYNLLSNGDSFFNDDTQRGLNNLLTENYKWGLMASFPLFLRKERGDLDLIKIKQSKTVLKQQSKRLELGNKLNAIKNDLNTFLQQIELTEDMVENYERLLEAEMIKFNIGESSVFLVNSRQQKLLEAQIKLTKLIILYHKTKTKLELTNGSLVQAY